MIEYDYKLVRTDKHGSRTFVPNLIPQTLPNITYIEGPNSSGKSTLLHLIALSLNGLERDNINSGLKRKMNSLLEDRHKLNFEIKIGNKDESLVLISQKTKNDEPNIEVFEVVGNKRKRLDKDRLNLKYNLIYDIPNDPTDRLKELTREIQEIQLVKTNGLASLAAYISQTINDIDNSKNPGRIKELSKNIKELEKEFIKEEEQTENKETFLEDFSKYVYTRLATEYWVKWESLDNEIKEYKNQKTKTTKERKKQSKEDRKLRDDTFENLSQLARFYRDLTPLIKTTFTKEDKDLVKLWDRININEDQKNREFKPIFAKLIKSLELSLKQKINRIESGGITQEVKIWNEVIATLERFNDKDLEIPGVNINVTDFIRQLKRHTNKHEVKMQEHENLNSICNQLIEMDALRVKIEDNFQQIKSIENTNEQSFMLDDGGDDSSEDELIKQKQEDMDNCWNMFTHYTGKCLTLTIDDSKILDTYDEYIESGKYEPYSSFNDTQLCNELQSSASQMKQMKTDLLNKKQYIGMYKKELEQLENKKEHRYQKHMEELKELQKTCLYLQQIMSRDYQKFISNIIDKKQNLGAKVSVNELEYQEAVFKYLAKRIPTIRHIDKEYNVIKIDMIKEKIDTEEGDEIYLIDMGTGHSQSAYLIGKLNVADNRKIIALFDEIAMMDDISLKPIFDKMRDLYNKEKLLCGIVVQKANTFSYREL